MRGLFRKARQEAAARPAKPKPTAWSRFLDHAVDCSGCRAGERCAFGEQLHRAVKAAVAATTP